MMSLVAYNALVTGANSDIGYEVCKKYLELGGKVIALYNSRHNMVDRLTNVYGEKIISYKVNFEDVEFICQFIENNHNLLNEVNIFIHLASIRESIPYGKITANNLLKHFKINVISAVMFIQHLSEIMMKHEWGRIVIGSSIGVKFGGGDESYCYSLTKYASEFIPKVHKKWATKNVLMNSVRIGVTNTSGFRKIGEESIKLREKLIPMKRMAEPDEIAKVIYYLASDENTYITGQSISVSGGE